MEKLKRRYAQLKRQVSDYRSVIDMIHAINEDLRKAGRVYAKGNYDEVRSYLNWLEASLARDCYEVEKQILQRILKLVESDMILYSEFVPYKYPADTSDCIINSTYMLCRYDGSYYLISGNKIHSAEKHLIYIYNDLTAAIEAFSQICQSFIDTRKSIDDRFALTPEQEEKLEKVKYNDIPTYNEILKHFKDTNGKEPYRDKLDWFNEGEI